MSDKPYTVILNDVILERFATEDEAVKLADHAFDNNEPPCLVLVQKESVTIFSLKK